MLRSVQLRDYMITNPVKIRPDANLMEAIQLITQHKVSGLCVVDEQDKLLGVLSELDCLRAILSATYNEGGIGTVRDSMASEDLLVSGPDDDIVDVAQDMLLNSKRRRPVVQDGKLVGQITCRQLLNAVKNFKS